MLLFLVLCILGVAFLLMPGVLEALVRQPIENPTWGIGLLAILVLMLVWNYKR